MTSRSAVLCIVAALLAGAAACDKTSHDKIDEWLKTEKGTSKLKAALGDGDLDPDLRAHAAQNLIRKGEEAAAFDGLQQASEASRPKIVAKLAPRLWENARMDKPMGVPSPMQSTAKDALFRVRDMADADTRTQIDAYLADWLTGGWYEGRAESGLVPGAVIIRAVGPPAGPKMIAALDSVIARPPDEKGMTVKVGNTLLLGVAVTGAPEAVGKLLDVMRSGALAKADPTLPERVMNALLIAYLDPEDFEAAPPEALAPHAATFAELAKDETQPPTVVQGAMNLLRAAGMPACLEPLVGMISHPHANPRYRWIATQRALDCGKLEALVPAVQALPEKADTAMADLEGTVWERAVAMGGRKQVAEKARTLLSSSSWVAKVTGAEILVRVGDPATAAADAAAVRALAGDPTPARGWWGDEKKAVPTVGKLLSDAAKRLEELAKPGPKKG
jgi:hypothetical protein